MAQVQCGICEYGPLRRNGFIPDLTPLLLRAISQTSIEIRSWISNYIHLNQWEVLINPDP